MNGKIVWITRTALFIALLIAVQYVTKPFGQFVTGSLVNLILISAGLLLGPGSGFTVAAVSPVLAFFAGIGPVFPQLIPLVMLGNTVIVVVSHIIAGRAERPRPAQWLLAIAAGALSKFLVLWIGIVKIALPLIPGIKEAQAAAMSATFSWPQLVTALIGGGLAMLVVPPLKRALGMRKRTG